jgi:hypothetical protein
MEVLDRATGLPVQPIVVRNARGRIIGPKETRSNQGKGGCKILKKMEAILVERSKKLVKFLGLNLSQKNPCQV